MIRRNKVGFGAAALVLAALLMGISVSIWQAVRATQAKQEALAARQLAEVNEGKATDAQANENKLRRQAEANELAARQRAYASDMNVAMQAMDGNNLGRALDLLNRQRPAAGQKDLRGWEWRYLWQQTHSDASFTLCKQSAEIDSLAVSPDGLSVAIGMYHQGGVSVWDLRTRQEVARLAANEDYVLSAFSPTEPLLAFVGTAYSPSRDEQDTLHLWNTATRQMVGEFPLDNGCIGLAFAKDGRTLMTSTIEEPSHNGRTTLWRVPEGTKLASYASTAYEIGPSSGFAATAATFCSTRRIVRPSALRRPIRPNISSTSSGESPSEGSSRMSRRGCPIRPRPMASICCSPPESVLAR
jgi:WD40 repeat protein